MARGARRDSPLSRQNPQPERTTRLALCQRLNLQLASFDRGLCKAAAHHQVAQHHLLIPN